MFIKLQPSLLRQPALWTMGVYDSNLGSFHLNSGNCPTTTLVTAKNTK